MRLLDGLGPDAEQGGDGDLGQPVTVVQDGGQQPVGQGEDRAAAGSRGGLPGLVAAALVQGGLALLVVERHQGGDQGVPLGGGQAGQRGVAEPGQCGAGLVERIGGGGWLALPARAERAAQSPCPSGRRV